MKENESAMVVKAPCEIRKEETPYLITEELRLLFDTYSHEFGTGNGVGTELPAEHVWVAYVEDLPVGYGWSAVKKVGIAGTHMNLLVTDKSQGQGVGKNLSTIEEFHTAAGVQALHAQVNGNQPESGKRMRQLLLKQGYLVVRSIQGKVYGMKTDEQIIATDPSVVFFSKPLIPKS